MEVTGTPTRSSENQQSREETGSTGTWSDFNTETLPPAGATPPTPSQAAFERDSHQLRTYRSLSHPRILMWFIKISWFSKTSCGISQRCSQTDQQRCREVKCFP